MTTPSRVLVLFILALPFLVEAQVIIDKCELAEAWQILHHLDNETIGTLMCIAMAESDLRVDAINYETGDYGLYQINNKYW